MAAKLILGPNANGNKQRDTVPTGMANVIGNKGAVVIAFSVNETRLCFVGCHLAPHLEQVSRICALMCLQGVCSSPDGWHV
jgi:hypothetical protein